MAWKGRCCGEIRTCERNCPHAVHTRIPDIGSTVGHSDTDAFPGGLQTPNAPYGGKLIGFQTAEGFVPLEPTYSDTKPAYYHAGPDDLIAFAIKHGIGAIEFTIMRYVMRWQQKQPLLSLQKAREYLDRLIAAEEERLGAGDAGVASKSDTDV